MSEQTLVITNANVITMWAEHPRARQVVVRGDRIAEVGDAPPPSGATVLDLRGRTLLPGFIDSHVHLVGLGLATQAADLAGAPSLADALDRIRARATVTPPGTVVRAPRWDESTWPEQRPLTRTDLDRAAPDQAVVAARVCGHVVVVNSRALEAVRERSGLDDAALAAAGADIETGTLPRGTSRYARDLAEPTDRERLDALADACRQALAVGVTMVHDLSDDALLYAALNESGRLSLRAYVARHPGADGAIPPPLPDAALGERLRTGPVKVFADGSLGARTAALHEPYDDRPDLTGTLYTEPEALAGLIAAAHRAGRQVACHAIGDRGIDTAVTAFETVLRDDPRKGHRHRIEHVEMPSLDAIVRMRALGLIASAQPNFMGRWGRRGGLYEARVGSRTAAMNPFRTMSEAGLIITFGSDGMPMDPLFGVWSAVTHPVERERLSPEEALWCATSGGAVAAFAEHECGRIAPLCRADFVVLAADPAAVEPEAIKDVPVVATLVDGEIAYGGL